MDRKLLCLVLLLALVLSGCASTASDTPVTATAPQYLTRINCYSRSGSLLDQYQIEYTADGLPARVTHGIQADEKEETLLGGAPVLPDDVALEQADASYAAVLLAPCDDGVALLVTGAGTEPSWGVVLGKVKEYTEHNGYLTKVTAGDGSYIALFYSSIADASAAQTAAADNSFPVTEPSDYYGYDAVLTALGEGVLAMELGETAPLNEALFSSLYASEPNKGDIGYTFVDLDRNGVMELLVGSRGQFFGAVIYDLYAIYNGRIVNVLSGTETAKHTLSSTDDILLETTNDNGQTVFAAFSYYNSSLRMIEAVIQGGGKRYQSAQSMNDADTFEEISYADAAAIREKYPVVEIEFTPLSDYIEATDLASGAE